MVSPDNRIAQRRLGMMALENEAFAEAAAHLEQAYVQEPDNRATLKALGYAYLWSGQVDMATDLLKQVNFRQRLFQELGYWQWQWGVCEKPQLANNANRTLEQLRQ